MRSGASAFRISFLVLVFFLSFSSGSCQPPGPKELNPEAEIYYHLFLRSFYDSNHDGYGDLNGLHQKLDYLQNLGITTILLTPLYDSPFYHNYFANDFYKIDAHYGSLEDYLTLLKEIHHRGMKLIMDMEIQYVTNKHEWFKDSYRNPKSPFSSYIIYRGPDNTDPVPILWNIDTTKGWDGQEVSLWTTDLYNPQVVEYQHKLFKYWVDPNQDGVFDDGVDGFRIDHMMDDLDWKNLRTGLLQKFWKPLIAELKEINPKILIIGEQADWGYGADYFKQAGTDLMFNFPLRFAFVSFDKKRIVETADTTYALIPTGKSGITFIENHDTDRLASLVERNLPKMKMAAAMNILFKGVPSIYYGQELGMAGRFKKYGEYDTNDLLRREAFEWYKTVGGEGMALWYKGSGPWWNETNLHDSDGISLEEEKVDNNSLWHFYEQLIGLRRTHNALQSGRFIFIDREQTQVLSFLRWDDREALLILINLSEQTSSYISDVNNWPLKPQAQKLNYLLGTEVSPSLQFTNHKISITLPACSIQIWQIQ